nr:MAG TPA_asm: hypothetical protein [Caudoviricetes sp.]
MLVLLLLKNSKRSQRQICKEKLKIKSFFTDKKDRLANIYTSRNIYEL